MSNEVIGPKLYIVCGGLCRLQSMAFPMVFRMIPLQYFKIECTRGMSIPYSKNLLSVIKNTKNNGKEQLIKHLRHSKWLKLSWCRKSKNIYRTSCQAKCNWLHPGRGFGWFSPPASAVEDMKSVMSVCVCLSVKELFGTIILTSRACRRRARQCSFSFKMICLY